MTTIFGYDPGGNGEHGVAALSVDQSYDPIKIVTDTCESVDDVTAWFSQFNNSVGIGIDTLTKWSTGRSGWRQADLWLRAKYPDVSASVVSPNSLYGSMVIGGMAVKSWFFSRYPKALISETHPKVLYFALNKKRYDWDNALTEMMGFLTQRLGISCQPCNNHEFDGIMSCYAVLEYLRGNWTQDLHAMPDAKYEAYIEPFGNSIYAWP